ncbi:MAG: hypothetical protein RSA62_00970, partial [Oscillospiraceae bacterium]
AAKLPPSNANQQTPRPQNPPKPRQNNAPMTDKPAEKQGNSTRNKRRNYRPKPKAPGGQEQK